MEAIIAGDYKFEPGARPIVSHLLGQFLLRLCQFSEEYWANVSDTAREFVAECLTIDPISRPTAEHALKHKVSSAFLGFYRGRR
jgi:calcium/calmodulin-dependent protein kinase I